MRESIAAKFVARVQERLASDAPIRAGLLAQEIDAHVTWARSDCNTMIFYYFSDGSSAGTKPAKPAALRIGKQYQVWTVEPSVPEGEVNRGA
jgi:hypothetical protein